MGQGVWYATMEAVTGAIDIAETARNSVQIRRAVASSSRLIDGTRQGEGCLHRRFYPEVATRYFDSVNSDPLWTLLLGRHELVSATSVVSGATTIASSDYILQPTNEGPPFDQIDLKTSVYGAWPGGENQRGIAVTGVWAGCRLDETAGGALAAAITDTTGTTVAVTDSASVGVGSLVRVDNERMIVTNKSQITTGQSLQTPMTAAMNNQACAVSNGAAFTIGEVILADAEKMRVVDIAGNTLVVLRAWDGSALAAHTGSTIYARRSLTVERGVLGTTAATHSGAAPIFVHVVPAPVEALCVAESVNTIQQELGAYGRSSGAGESASIVAMGGLQAIRDEAEKTYGRPVLWIAD